MMSTIFFILIEKIINIKYSINMFWKKRPEIRQLFGHLSGYGCLTKYIETEEELMILASSVFGVQNFKDALE